MKISRETTRLVILIYRRNLIFMTNQMQALRCNKISKKILLLIMLMVSMGSVFASSSEVNGVHRTQKISKLRSHEMTNLKFDQGYPFSKEELVAKLEKLFETDDGQVTPSMLQKFTAMKLEDFAIKIDPTIDRFTKERFLFVAKKIGTLTCNWIFSILE